MNEKRKQILEAAIRLFARKGYQATSIQEIVDEVGIAKGSLYFHFKSKEDLLISIYKYYLELISSEMTDLQQEENLSPRERLEAFIVKELKFVIKHRDFLKMQMQERVVISAEIENVLLEFRHRMRLWQKDQILDLYGPSFKTYVWDGAALFGAMKGEYLSYLIFEQQLFDFERLAEFLVDRLDDIMNGMLTKGKPPLFDESILQDIHLKWKSSADGEQGLIGEVQNLRAVVESWLDEAEEGQVEGEEILSSITLLEQELLSDEPQMLIVKGMLAYLKSLKQPELKRMITSIQRIVEDIE